MIRNTDIPIYDINSQEIGSICCYQYSSLVNNNIFYTKLPESPAKDVDSLEYWLYNIDTKENNYLGTVDD
ncbi:MAG: hypothetical protein K2G63_02445 [Oscillospiraceae bacterium]|nr:hypothetical protein [Oscillospiraceae bacterium]